MGDGSIGIAGLVTVKEAARLLGITPEAVRQRLYRQRIFTWQVGRTLLFRLSDVQPPTERFYEGGRD